MEEQAKPVQPAGGASYAVMELYKSSWNTIKKNLLKFVVITLIGVAISVAITTIMTFLIINNLFDSVSGLIASSAVAVVVGVLASVFVTLLQVVSLKKATEKGEFSYDDVMQDSLKFTPRAIGYGLFITLVLSLAFMGVVGVALLVGPLGALLSIALVVLLVVLLFRYAFLQFLIIEEKPMGFLDRFRESERLTKGIYMPIFLVFLVGILVSIATGIVGGVLASPFQKNAQQAVVTNEITFDFENIQNESDFEDALNDSIDDAAEQTFNVNYLIATFITSAFSWGAGLLILGASLELYKRRKTELGS